MLKLEYDKQELEQVIDKIDKKTMNMDSDMGLAMWCSILWNFRCL